MFKKKFFINKKGIVIGVIIAVLLISYHIFSTPAHRRGDTFLSAFGLLMILGVIFGGALSGLIIEKYLRARLLKVGRLWGGLIGSILISPLALVSGVAFSTVGIGYGELLGSMIGMRQIGIYVGLFVTIVLVVIIVECAGAGIGAFSGSFIQSVVQRFFHHAKR